MTPQELQKNPYADKAAAQLAAMNQPVAASEPSPAVQEQVAGKAAANQGTPVVPRNIFTQYQSIPVPTEPIAKQPVQEKPVEQPVVQQQTKPYTGGPDNPEKAMDYLSAMYTSPQREEELRKASIQQQRIMAVANALRHIGNIYYTSKGATPQQFNDPVTEERTRYLKEKAIRDQNNYRYMTYQQAKAAQEQKAKQWEQQFKLNQANAAAQAAYRQEQARIAAANAASQDAYRRGNLARQEAADKARNDYNERKLKQQISHQNRMAGIAGMKAQNDKRRTDAYVEKMKNGGGGKSTQSIPLRSPYGTINAPGRSIPQAQWNQAYSDFEKKGWIKKSDFEKRMAEIGAHGKSDPDYVRNRLVAEVIANNGEASNYMRDNFRWTYDNNPTAYSQQPAQQGYTLPQWQWGQQQTPSFDPLMPTSSQADEDDEEDLFDDDMNFSGISI